MARLCLAVFFIAAGALHFIKTPFYLKIMPRYLPYPLALVYISGVFEIAGGAGVLVPGLRRAAGYGLIALLLAVFPANIQMAADMSRKGWVSWSAALALLRLPVQFLLLWWVYAAALR